MKNIAIVNYKLFYKNKRKKTARHKILMENLLIEEEFI